MLCGKGFWRIGFEEDEKSGEDEKTVEDGDYPEQPMPTDMLGDDSSKSWTKCWACRAG